MNGRFGLVVALALAALLALPLAWVVLASLSPEHVLFGSGGLGIGGLSLDHYASLFARQNFWVPIRNSLVVASATTLCCLVIGSGAAYALARLEFPGRGAVLGAVLAVSMFPQISIVQPLYALLRSVGLIDTYPGLVLPYLTFALPLTVWLLVSYFRQLPSEIEQAAMIDGASRMRVLVSIVLPLSLPGIVSSGIVAFIYCWNEFLFALSFTVGPDRQTVPVAVAFLRGRHQVPWGEVFAATVVATAPVVALVLAFQRRIVEGLASGAVKS
ncbi:MAG: carbohydrate ABC transporter permease [Pseudomonadota bacterium]|nr:MAG: sugar ABC transporter permease [Pseudomonadota bacterium]